MRAVLFLLRFHVNGMNGGDLVEIPLIAIELVDTTSKNRRDLLARCGHMEERRILLSYLEGGHQAHIAPERWMGWGMKHAHEALYDRFQMFKDGCVFNADTGEIE